MTVYDYREITLKEDLCLDISRDTDIENHAKMTSMQPLFTVSKVLAAR